MDGFLLWVCYCFCTDRVFGPATTTRRVYDVAAQHVVNGAMGGVNGTVFAYGVTSSGKTHTMHGEQKSPGIIPLAIKDVFGIIQEVINDLLDPTGQNLRVREDAQGTYVEGIKEEVVLSPAHALSLIASGEEHRHVGSNNFNLLSSRSHTIFTLTIESSPRGENQGEEVTLSQLHLIDLAGSESSKTETTGLRRKEGSYINKSLLTLGTVISKLTDGKATHIPYRDSKLTRLLQSSLSGHGRVSLICTVTPASSNTEETHNTLKFAHRSKHVEIKASQNKILDEKSLIKKYQKEISNLKQELEQLKRGMMENQNVAPVQEDLVNLKLELEAGKVKLQSRLEEEEQAKAALMGRIQRLTKLILVSTKSTIQPNVREKPSHRRRHSFGEDELAYLPDRKRECMIDDDIGSINSEVSADGRVDVTDLDELVKDYKRNRRRGMLGWFKLKKPDNLVVSSSSADYENSANSSLSTSSKSSQGRVTFGATKDGQRKSVSKRGEIAFAADFLPEITQAGDLFSAAIGGRQLPATGTTIADQIDLLREQVKMLAGEVALCISSLKRVSEQAAKNPEDLQLQEQMKRLKDEIREKKLQINILEQRMIGSVEMTPKASSNIEMSQALSKLASQLNEKTFELEIKSADNRVLQEQLKMKVSENAKMQETILLLRQQLDAVLSGKNSKFLQQSSENEATSETCSNGYMEAKTLRKDGTCLDSETVTNENTPASSVSLDEKFMHEDTEVCRDFAVLNSKLLMQAAEIESLKQEKVKSTEEKDGLEIQCQKLAEEASYAKELAAAAAVELRSLAEEVTKLSYQNAKLTGDLTAGKDACCTHTSCQRFTSFGTKQNNNDSSRANAHLRKPQDGISMEELEQELNIRYQREASLVAALSERDKIEAELRRRLDEAKRHEADLENELANMWVVVAKMRKSGTDCHNPLEEYDASKIPQPRSASEFSPSNEHACSDSIENEIYDNADVSKACCHLERQRCKDLENLVSRLKGDDLGGLDMKELEELQNLHVEAITKICYAKCSTDVL
nr:kinesin-like protein KIN-7C, mitochondrial [Ipomoea batatas]